MAKVLMGIEVDEIMEECRTNGVLSEYEEDPEYFGQIPSPLGWGYGRQMQLRPGLWLGVSDFRKRQTHTYKDQHQPKMPLILAFYLSGGIRVDNAA